MTDRTAVAGVIVRVARSERHNLRDQDREQEKKDQRPGA